MGKEKLIPIFAFIIILIGSISSIYGYVNQIESGEIQINGHQYSINQLFYISQPREFEDFSGIALDDLIFKIGIVEGENHEYNIVGSDGYQKTVKWENMKNGLLTDEGQVIFSDLPKAFRVKDIIKIEVK